MANRRFEMYQYRQILSRMRLGDSDRDLSRADLIGRKKAAVFRQLAKEHGWLEGGVPLPDEEEIAARLSPTREKAAIPSLVEPHREQVEKWVAEGIDGTTIHRALRRLHSFPGSYSAVRRFIQALPEHLPKATVVLDYAAGSAAQVDFGAGPKFVDPLTGEVVSSWFFVMTLCFSRHQYAEVVYNQRVETWLACHRRAFEWFGGVPEKLIIDNAKCAITRACAKDPEVQRAYGDLALGYGFRIDPCPPRDPQKKGLVESGVKYIKRAFLPIREFRDIDDANRQLREWIVGEAGNRCHGTTRRRPLDLFAETEQPLLQPLPDVPVQLAAWAKVKVHGNGHVAFEKNFYSVPFRLIHQTLWLKATDTTVQLFRDHELVAVHCRLQGCGGRATVDEHLPPDALAYKLRDPQWCLKQAEETGPACLGLIQRLFASRVLDNLRGAQGVIRLGDRYGKTRLNAACARALLFDTPRYRAVKTILERGQDQLPEKSTETPLPSIYAGKSRFQRAIATLFN
jgi:transposase